MSVRDGNADAGFTVVEVVLAMTVIAIGLLATMAALQHGLNGIETGRGESVATVLVEDKLEDLKALALVDWTNAALREGTRTEYCRAADFDCSDAPSTDAFRRTTTLVDGAGGTCATSCKVVTVSVFYRAVDVDGQLDQERRVSATTMFVARP
jgi:prepilin-type N-terminal cleavage/methylation domain-containing protein